MTLPRSEPLTVELVTTVRVPPDHLHLAPDDGTPGWREHAGHAAEGWAREHPVDALRLAVGVEEAQWLW